MLFLIFYFVLNHAYADVKNMISYFREKPIELLKMEYFNQVVKPILSSQKSYLSSRQSQLSTTFDVNEKKINDLGLAKTSLLGSRNLKERSISLSSSYALEKNGVLNSLKPSVFVQNQKTQVEYPASSISLGRGETESNLWGVKIEYDILKNGLRSNGYLQNNRSESQAYGQYASSLGRLNDTYKQLQQNLLNLFSLNCRLLFAESNQIKLEEAQNKIDIAFKIKMVTFSHVLNISEQLNSNDAQKQSLSNDLNRLINNFNSISPNLGETLLEEIKKKIPCEFDQNFVKRLNDEYKTEDINKRIDNFKNNVQYHSNLSSYQLADTNYKLIKNKGLPDVRPYVQITQGRNNNRISNLNYDDRTIEVGLSLRLGFDPSTIRDEIMAQFYDREASATRLNFTKLTYSAEVERISKSIELRKKLIISAQRALEASDKQIKYNESQRGLKNIDTLTLINGFRTRVQSVATLVDTFVTLEQDYIEYKTYSNWKYVEHLLNP
jgi:hypothetical protein